MPGRKSINHNDMRNMNLALVMNSLHQFAPISRAQLAELTGLNRASVTSIIRDLMGRGFVIELGTRSQAASIGHPSIDLMINPDAGRVIGAEIGGNFVSAVVTNLTPKILWRCELDAIDPNNLDEIIGLTMQVIYKAYEVASESNLPILGMGLALPGLADIVNNVLLFASDLGWQDVPIGRLIGDQFPVPFYIGNKAHMAALGESYFGAARNSETSVYINLGSSIFGGVIVNDNVLPGVNGLAGEIGHMVLDPNGDRCGCGNFGCWNTLVNQRALLKRIEVLAAEEPTLLVKGKDKNTRGVTIKRIVEAARDGDKVALKALQQTGSWLGIGIANLINLLNPQYIVIGGLLSAAFEFFLPAIQEEVRNRALKWMSESCQIVPAENKEDAGVIGAVATVFWNIFNNPQYSTQPSMIS